MGRKVTGQAQKRLAEIKSNNVKKMIKEKKTMDNWVDCDLGTLKVNLLTFMGLMENQ